MLTANTSAPDFHLTGLNGDQQTLSETLKRGPVLVAFFKTSCPTCQLTFPYLERLAKGSAAGAPQIIAISQDSAKDTRRFHDKFGITLPTLLDPADAGYVASNAYQITHVPSLFFVEQDGRISSAMDGFNRSGLEALGERFSVQPFRKGEKVPELRPG